MLLPRVPLYSARAVTATSVPVSQAQLPSEIPHDVGCGAAHGAELTASRGTPASGTGWGGGGRARWQQGGRLGGGAGRVGPRLGQLALGVVLAALQVRGGAVLGIADRGDQASGVPAGGDVVDVSGGGLLVEDLLGDPPGGQVGVVGLHELLGGVAQGVAGGAAPLIHADGGQVGGPGGVAGHVVEDAVLRIGVAHRLGGHAAIRAVAGGRRQAGVGGVGVAGGVGAGEFRLVGGEALAGGRDGHRLAE